jgi:ABC-2 type transport system ATP-binding protein
MKALELDQVSKVYRGEVHAVKAISLEVNEGDFFALLGPNGAGKTSIIGIITSLVNKTSGTIRVFGHDLDKEVERVKSYIGVVPQEINLNAFEKAKDILVNQAGFFGIRRKEAIYRADKYLDLLQLKDKQNQISRSLSGGMKRRLMIARALMHDPRLLILDEPTAGVDIEIRRSMWAFLDQINKDGKTIILTTHYLEEAEALCRNIAILAEGTIIENDSMENVVKKLQREVFVITFSEPVKQLQPFEGMNFMKRNMLEVEIEMPSLSNLNKLIGFFDAQKIQVTSIRPKRNRLEELFVKLLDQKKSTDGK